LREDTRKEQRRFKEPMPLLEIKGVSMHFGGLAALERVSFQVSKGEIVGLIGPNGAGKTTMFNVISGIYRPTIGKIMYHGKNIAGCKFHKVSSMRLVRTFQLSSLYNEMTVLENVAVAHHLKSKTGFWGALFDTRSARRDRRDIEQSAIELLEFVRLAHFKYELAKNLPHGPQRALGVAIALAASPELLLLDEPLTGMHQEERLAMTDIIKALRDNRGITLMIVEHNIRAVMSICDRIVVLNFGNKIAEGLPAEICQNKNVVDAYLGSSEEDIAAKTYREKPTS
jgi:branched-chain amino acid transport system ATP-binding protein